LFASLTAPGVAISSMSAVLAVSALMSTVQPVKKRARQEQQVREDTHQVGRVLG